jgi:hypothetical protein
MTIKNAAIVLTVITLLFGCEKQEGRGGRASIVGQVYQNVYDNNDSLIRTEEAREVDVYIVYGKDGVYDDNMNTHYDGRYEFSFLYPGNYKLFAYSECDSCPSKTVAVEVLVEIKDNKETIEAPIIFVDNL